MLKDDLLLPFYFHYLFLHLFVLLLNLAPLLHSVSRFTLYLIISFVMNLLILAMELYSVFFSPSEVILQEQVTR